MGTAICTTARAAAGAGLACALVLALAGAAFAGGGAGGPSLHPVPPAARAEIAAVRAAVARYADIEAAKADGWFPFGGEEPLIGQHWHHEDTPDYVAGHAIDFARPTNLMYAEIDGAMVLTGVTFGVRLGEGDALPEGFAGAADEWHVHDLDLIRDVAMADRPILSWLSGLWLDYLHPSGQDGRRRRAMLHVWVTVDNPDGPFALSNPALGYLKHGLDPAAAAGHDRAVARGLALAAEDGCRLTYGPRLEVADAGRAQRGAIMGACADVTARVRAALAEGGGAYAPVAAEAANHLAALYWLTLDAEQHARVGAMADHGDAFCEPQIPTAATAQAG